MGERPKTKKALKEAMRDDPASVVFDPTAAFGTQEFIRGDDVPSGVVLVVVGPDPYTKRTWYANVTGTKVS